MPLPKNATIVEVGPRDGLQNEKTIIPTALKVKFINALSAAGLKVIETTSFVSPKWVPQMADHSEVYASINKEPGVAYPVLIPNLTGLNAANQVDVKSIAVFTAASNTFTQKNTNCTIAESLQRISAICQDATAQGLHIRGYISCVIGCPYEGDTDPNFVADVAKQLIDMGCHEISLGDTIGVGTPLKVQQLIEAVSKNVALDQLGVHMHDTYGQALANIYASLEMGIHTIDSSAAGLGGCPYAKGAGGNVATEDIIYMLDGLGIETGVDLNKVITASNLILDFLKTPTRSKAALALQNKH